MTKNSKKTKEVLGFYWRAVSRYKISVVLGSIFIPLAVIGNNLLPPLILARVLDRLGRRDFIEGELWKSFGNDILAYAGLVFFAGLILWRLVDAVLWRLEAKVQRDLAQKVFKHLTEQSADFHANHFSGSLVSQNNKLLSAYVRMADTTFFITIPLFTTIFASAAILSTKSPLFAVALIIFSALYITIALIVSRPGRKASARHAALESKQTGRLADAITNAMAVKSFATNESEFKQYAKVTENTRAGLLKLMRVIQFQMLYFTSMTTTIMVASLILALVSVVNYGADLATAFLIFNYTGTIISQLFQFSNQALRNYNRSIGDASEMVEILETPADVTDPLDPEPVHISRGHIRLEKVDFQHKDADEAIFRKLSISVKPGEKVGLVGRSGSGKTTLTRLLLRFSDIQSGRITIDDQDISRITQNDLRRHMAYVPQEPLLFHRTIAENIGYGDPNATPEQIEAVARQAHAAEFIEKLPEKYNTVVGERGVKLSGGQRQRVAIARAMLKNAPILILDEATSALDSESEELIQDALWKLMEGRTAIVIAHRLSTIQKMDRVLVMENGRVVEEGSHKELIRQNGTYARLWAKQSGGFIDDQDGE